MSDEIGGDLDGRVYSASEGSSSIRGRAFAHVAPHDFRKVQGHQHAGHSYGQRYHGSKAWWSVGELIHQGITHQSVGLSLAKGSDETWELSDSLADLYQAVTQRQQQKEVSKTKGHNRSGSGGRADDDRSLDMRRWMDEDTRHGFIRVYMSEVDISARLFPCTLSTSAQKICLMLGIPGNALHVQMNGDVIRRMEPSDCPLAIQNEFLASLGYSDIKYIQEEGPKEDLACLIRFYAGKPLSDSTYARNQLTTFAYIRKGKLLHQWARRLCVLSGTRLMIFREKGAEPSVMQLARGSVEDVQIKGQTYVLKLTSTYQGERSLYISFVSQEEYDKWLRKIKKATAKLPSKADLSNCHLEFIPETVFINTELQVLILRHNALRERPIEEDIYTIGWLDDLPRFTALRSLNLANNQLINFPLSLCNIRSLMELNLASNKLEEIPSQISELVNLQVLHLHNNRLSSLPDEIALMRNLTVIVLAFNHFTSIPTVLLQSQHSSFMLDSIIMAGNQILRLPADHLSHMTHIKKIDLRLNKLQLLPTETAKFQSLEHITHIDIRENHVTDLDIRAVRCLEYLNCERNNIRSLQVNGAALRNLFASHNCLQTLTVNPKPEWLISMDVSHNKLTELPNWLPDCFFLTHLDVSHNELSVLPDRLFTDAKKLKILKVNHNKLISLPEKIRTDTLEELHLQHNLIRQLSVELFIKAHRLRYLNVTRNKLCDLPPPNKNDSYNKLQELYLSFNHLADRCLHKICCFPRLRVLHLAKNKISIIEETDIEKLEQLMELNVSSNNLTYLPAVLGRHPKLQVLRANCNLLQELPNFKNSSGLKVLEVSSNHLLNVNMSNLMASQMSVLDISANPNILVKSHDIDAARSSKRLCMVDMRGQNLSLEDLWGQGGSDEGQLWQTGLSQTSGIRNKLSVRAINKPHFSDKGDALFAIFDGGRNDAVANALFDIIPNVIREERAQNKNPYVYLKYCFLSAHRSLKTQGQKLGASAVVLHLYKNDEGQHVLSVGNVGDAQVVLCRQKRAYLLSRHFYLPEDVEDKNRVIQSEGIITEDGRVSGVTYNTRLLGCSYLFPQVIPDPHVTSTVLTPEDTFFIVASHGLWKYVTYEEAIRETMDIPDPVEAAKRLQDLAQGYGSKENISVLVVRLLLSVAERSRIKELMRVQRSGQKELIKVLSRQEDLLQLRDGVPKVEELSGIVINKAGHAKKHRISHKHLQEPKSVRTSQSAEVFSGHLHEHSSSSDGRRAYQDETSVDGIKSHKKLRKEMSEGDALSHVESHSNRKMYISSHGSLENLMRKRLVDSEDSLNDRVNNGEKVSNQMKWQAMKQADEVPDNLGNWGLKVIDENEVVNTDVQKWLSKLQDSEAGVSSSLHREMSRNFIKAHSDDGFLDKSGDDIDHGGDNIHDGEMHAPARESSNDGGHVTRNTYTHMEGDEAYTIADGLDDSYHRSTPSEEFSVSPCESVSSIDVRVQHETDEMNKFQYLSNPENRMNETGSRLPITEISRAGFSENEILSHHELYTRPLSPDSIISQDEFVKPPVNFSNIDRDALLFHQMQMARAQTQGISNASLDSVQSAPMHSANRDSHSNIRTSSHSIEVLVNFGEQGASRGIPQREGKSVMSNSFSGKSNRSGTLTSSRVANMGSQSDNQSRVTNMGSQNGNQSHMANIGFHSDNHSHVANMGSQSDSQSSALRSFEKIVQAELHAQAKSGNRAKESTTDNGGDGSDSDNDTLVGDAEDLAQISGHDSDSDCSLGNASLEDGYAVIQFPRLHRQGSLSMMNVLESECEDYPEQNLVGKKFFRTDDKSQRGASFARPSAREDDQLRKVTLNKKKARNNDYETIDFDDSNVVHIKNVDEFKDDINIYEDVHDEKDGKVFSSKLPVRAEDVSGEEDIDALYVKVNQIKMKKLKSKYGGHLEHNQDHLENIFPGILQSDQSEHKRGRLSRSAKSFGETKAGVALRGMEEEDGFDDDDRDIFISASDILPASLVHSGNLGSTSAQSATFRGQQTRQENDSPLVAKKVPPASTSMHSSSSASLLQAPLTAHMCNIRDINQERTTPPLSIPAKSNYQSPESLKSSSGNIKHRSVSPHHQNQSSVPPPLPPKMPYPKTQDFIYSDSSVKAAVPQRPQMKTFLNPSSRNPTQKSTASFQYSHPNLSYTSSLSQSVNSSHSSDQSVLSAHELYPESHQPSSLFHSSSEISGAASKLPTQKSITITYL